MFHRLFKSLGDSALRHEVDRLTAELADVRQRLKEEQSKNHILGLEQDNLLAVLERDRQRVLAETKRYSAEIASNEVTTGRR